MEGGTASTCPWRYRVKSKCLGVHLNLSLCYQAAQILDLSQSVLEPDKAQEMHAEHAMKSPFHCMVFKTPVHSNPHP